MHELSICQSIIEQVLQIASDNHSSKVNKILLNLGPLSGVEEALLSRAFPLVVSHTIAEEAELIITQLAVKVHCTICHNENEASVNKLLCSACGSWQTRLISGDEMLLASVELEKLTTNP